MSRVLVISGHPDIDKSYTNKVILAELEKQLPDVEVRRLDKYYPDYRFDVQAEQEAMLKADILVLQFPFYWYSVPGIMKLWMDSVFTFNFSFGPEGDKLKGKHLILSFTVGGPQQSYQPLGYNHFTVEQLLTPIQQTAYLAGMNYHPPVYAHGMVYIPDVYNTQEGVESRAREQANRLIDALNSLSETGKKEEVIKEFVHSWFKEFDKLPEDPARFLKHIDGSLHLDAPDGTFRGIDGFKQWYQTLRQSFKPDCIHTIERIDTGHLEQDHYQTELLVKLEAESFNNETVKLMAKEKWRLSIDNENHITLFDYRIELI